MADKTVEILIAVDSRLKGLEQTIAGLNAGKSAATALGGSLQTAFSIDLVSRFNSALSGLASGLKNSVMEGVKFNAVVQDATLGVAAVLRQFSPDKFKTFDAALGSSAQAIDLLKEKAKASPATFEQLVGAFQGLSGAATSANIPLKKQVDLVVLLSQGLAGLGVRSDQILQEGRALLTGNITEDAAAARILGITKADIDNAKNSGELFDFLSEKLSAFSEAGVRGAQGYTYAVSNLEDVLTQLKGEAFAPVFESLRVGILGLNEALSKTETVDAFKGLGEAIGSMARKVLELTTFLVDHAATVKTVAEVLALVTIGYAATQMTTRAAEWVTATLAVGANTVALERNGAAAVAAAVQQRMAAATSAYAQMPLGVAAPLSLSRGGAATTASMAAQAAQFSGAVAQSGAWSRVGAMVGGNIASVFIAAKVGWEIGGAMADRFIEHVGKANLATNDIIDNSQKKREELRKSARDGEISMLDAHAQAQKQINALDAEERKSKLELSQTILPSIKRDLENQIEQIGIQRDAWKRVDATLETVTANARAEAQAVKDAAEEAKAKQAAEANLAAEKAANGSADMNLLRAKASGNDRLIAQVQHEKDISDAIAQAEQLGMTALGTKTRYAQTLVGLKEQELMLATRLRLPPESS